MYNENENDFQIGGIMKRSSYSTKQKELLFEIIKNETSEFTIKELYNKLNGRVGLTTIYRLVDELVNKGVLSKIIGKDNNTYYLYSECEHENHFYLKCDKCGKMIHVDCDCITELSSHITKNHNFKLNNNHIIINGTCDYCSK